MRKICVVITARASYCRVKNLLDAILYHPDLDLQIILMDESSDAEKISLRKILNNDGYIPAAYCRAQTASLTLASAPIRTAGLISQLAPLFEKLAPDIVVTIADRYETLATAITASYMHIPLAHIQGGEHSGNIDEKVRHAVTKLADIHFVATSNARDRVIDMGEDPERVFRTGCPAIDLAWKIRQYEGNPTYSSPLTGSSYQKYIVVMQHPVTSEFEHTRKQMLTTLYAFKNMDAATLVFAPNQDPGCHLTRTALGDFLKNNPGHPTFPMDDLPPENFLRLLRGASCIVGNSSAGIRECSVLGTPAVNIGSRQYGREKASNVISTDHNTAAIAEALKYQMHVGQYPPSELYGSGDAARQIVHLLSTQPLTTYKKPMIRYALES